MLKPHKYFNLEKSVLNLSYHILLFLKQYKIIKYNVLYDLVSKEIEDDVGELFLSALSLLYILGLVNYISENDTVEIII